MPEIPFTQYLRPNGRTTDATIDRPKEIYDKAMDIIKAGYRFEAEVLSTGHVSLTIYKNGVDHDIEVVENGPKVPVAVDQMITRFYEDLVGKAG